VQPEQIEIIKTHDESLTLFHHQFKERYHSIHGAIAETMHVFINMGLKKVDKDVINILDFGLGTGLNALLTYLEGKKSPQTLNYHALEAYPIEMDKIAQLNYIELLNAENEREFFNAMHHSNHLELLQKNQFNFAKHLVKWEDFETDIKFDLIYFDAFAPTVQPELWTIEVFEKLYNMMSDEAILVTYCAKGYVKRNIKAAKFILESLSGPPGKREMTRAVKIT
jgi:tRNA U34 5-methylaminomethyl-2-thiouridine-forming methyltransferase MnmC